ncbi:Uncharacterised protein [Mycoplasmopsis gallinacea]|uniref:Uncharacterized protein n=1 Tax=Mycoplasmopsis gallinacea TaxID=29556 RepID=A0A449A326_9BACT|nr:Uncharacterised protein [Mycoplasmopsis gallinacea]
MDKTLPFMTIFNVIYKKIILLANNNTSYKANFIFMKAWNLIRFNLLRQNKIIYSSFLLSWFWVIFVTIIFILSFTKIEFFSEQLLLNGILFGMILFFHFVLFPLCYLVFWTRKRKIENVDKFLNTLEFSNDGLFFDKQYKETTDFFTDDFIEFKWKPYMSRFYFKPIKVDIKDFSEGFYGDKFTNLWLTYFAVWGIHLDIDGVKNNNYEHVYQQFVNTFASELERQNIKY